MSDTESGSVSGKSREFLSDPSGLFPHASVSKAGSQPDSWAYCKKSLQCGGWRGIVLSDPEDCFAGYRLSDVGIQRSCECFAALCFKAAAHRSGKGIPDLWGLFFPEPVSEQYSAGGGLFCADHFAGRIRAVKTLLAGRPEQRPGIHFAERCGVGSAAGSMQCDAVDHQRSDLASADGRGTGLVYPFVHPSAGCDPEGTASK